METPGTPAAQQRPPTESRPPTVKDPESSTDQQRLADRGSAFAQLMTDGLLDRASLSEELIRGEANLNSDVLDDIAVRLGLAIDFFDTKQHLLDEQLLKRRNSIAHGDFLNISLEEYLDLHGNIVSLLNIFTARVLAAADQSAFRSQPMVCSSQSD